MILAAIVLFVLWSRGYLATWIGQITSGLSGTTVAKPLTLGLPAVRHGGPGAESTGATT